MHAGFGGGINKVSEYGNCFFFDEAFQKKNRVNTEGCKPVSKNVVFLNRCSEAILGASQ